MKKREIFPFSPLVIGDDELKKSEYIGIDPLINMNKNLKFESINKPDPNSPFKSEFPSLTPEYNIVLAEVEEEIKKFSAKLKRKISGEIDFITTSLPQINNFEVFLDMNYILIFHIEFKDAEQDIANLAEKLRIQVEVIISNSNKNQSFKPQSSKKGNTKKIRWCENQDIIKRVLKFICVNESYFSESFQEKTMKNLQLNLTIFKEEKKIEKKDSFMNILMSKNIKFFDRVLKFCKNNGILKYYDYHECAHSIIQCFYDFIVSEKKIENFKQSDDEREINTKVLEYCFKNKLKSLITYITDNKENILLIPRVILYALENKVYDHLKNHLKNKKLVSCLAEKIILQEIFHLKNDPKTFLDFLQFMYALKDAPFKNEAQRLIYEEFKNFLKNEFKICYCHKNPLLIFVAFSQIFYRISNKCNNFNYAFIKFAKDTLSDCKEFVDNYYDFDHLQILVYHSYAPLEKSVLDMIFEDTDFFYPFFEEKRLSTIVRHNFDNCIFYDFNILGKSSLFKAIIEDIDLKYVDYVSKNKEAVTNEVLNFFNLGVENAPKKESIKELFENKISENYNVFGSFPKISESIPKKTDDPIEINHFYQRNVFFGANSLRLLIEFIVYFGLFVYILIFTKQYTDGNTFLMKVNSDYILLITSHNLPNVTFTNATYAQWLQDDWPKKYNPNYLAYRNASVTSDLYSCWDYVYERSFSFNLSDVLVDDCTNFNIFTQQFSDMNHTLMALFVVIILITGDLIIRKGYQIIVLKLHSFTAMDAFESLNMIISFVILLLYSEFLTISYENITDFQKRLGLITLFFAIFVFIQWLKITQYIKFWSKFGFIIKTIELMVRKTITFMFVYFINIAAFCSVLYVIYSDGTDFTSFPKGLRNLFGYSLGQFNFPDPDTALYQCLISIILIVFLVISNIVLLNLLIAILSNVFNKLVSRIDLENSLNYFMLQKEYFFDEKYGNLAFFPRTFNIFLLPLHIITIYFESERLALLVINVYYTLFFIIILVFYLVFNILLMPIIWTKILVLIVLNRYYHFAERKLISAQTRSVHFMLWFFFGFFYLIFVVFNNDIPIFVRSAYNKIEMPIKHTIQLKSIMQTYILNIMNLIQNKKAEKDHKDSERKLNEERTEKVKKKIPYDKLAKIYKSSKAMNKYEIVDQEKVENLEKYYKEIDMEEVQRFFNLGQNAEKDKNNEVSKN